MPPKRKAPSKKTDAPAPAPAPASEEEPTPAPSKRGKSTPKKDDEDIKSTPTRTSSRSQSSSQTSSQEIDQTPFQVDLTTTNREELVKRLKKLSAALASYQQKPLPILKTLAHQLIDRHITTHRSQEVRLLAACSIADLLRIFAPNPPYNQKELQAVFDLFFDQLKGLSEPSNPNYARYFYLLESLAVVNSCLILCQFKSDRPLITLFELFFHLMKDDPAPRVEFHILDILSQCVSELDVITPGVLDAILVNVIAPGKDDNPHAATLAMKLIDRHHDILERPISSLLIDGLFRPTSDGTQSEVVKERSDFLDLLYELNKHVPTLLVNLTNDQLELLLDEDANRRLEHVQVYGKLCTDADTAFVRANEPIFHGLLGRYTDVSTAIREQMAIFTQDFLIHHEFHRDLIVKNAIPILNDRDEKVRTAMYKAIAAAGLASADAIPKNLFEEFVKRTVDKKLAARRTTLDGLAHLFAKHCADAWKNGQPLSQAAKKYAMIPRKIIAVANIDQFMALNSEILLDETLLGLKNNVIERTRCMIGIMASMLAGAESRIALILERLMHDKNTAQQTIRSVLRLTADAKGRSLDKQQDKLRNMKVQQLAAKLVFNPQEEGVEDISQVIISLLEDRDKNVQKFLGILADPVQEYDALRTAKNELIRILRVDKQGKKLGALRRDVVATRLATKMQTTILNVETIPVLLAEIQQNVTQNRLSLASAGLHLLLIIARVFPIMLINSVEDLVSLYQMADANEEVTTKILQILSHCLSGSSMNKAVSNQLRDLLVDAATNTSSTPDRVTYAVKAIARLFHDERITAKDEKFDPADRILDDILKTLISTRLTVDGTNVVEALVACTQVAEVAPKAFHKHKETIVQFITKQLLPNEQSELLEARITSLSTLVAYLHSISSNTTEATTLGRPIMRMLLTILTRQGAVEKVKAEKSHQEKTEEEQEQEKAEHDALLLASATSLVDLCTRTVYFKLLVHPSASVAGTKPNFPLATLAMVAHHETEQVRLSFCKHIMDRFAEQSNKPPFVFATILSYMAHEHQHKIKQQYLKSLTNMITRQRQIVRILLDVQGDKHASQQLPEFYIAELIYLLSYHADWELDAEEFELYNYFWQLLSFYLDALISDKEQGHNFALILQITQSIKQCEDVRDPTNERIYLLAELAQLALRDKFQNKDWSHATHPGEITLPSYMYRARATPPKTRYLPESYTGPKSEKSAPGTPTKEKGIKRKIATPSTSEKGSAKKAKKEGGSAKKKKEPKEKAEPTRARLSRGAKQDLSYAEDLEAEDAMDEDEELTSPRAKAASTPKSSKKTTPSKKTPAKKEMEDEDEEDADIENKAVQDSFDFSEESAAPASASRARPKESVSSAIARLTSSKSKPAATSSSSTSSKGKTTSSTSKTAAAATANGKPASAKKAAPKAKPAADEEVEENDEEEEEPVIEKKEAPKRATPTKKTAAATSPKKASPKKAAAKTRASQAAAEEADENEATSPAVSTPSPSKKTRTRSPATRASPRQPVSSRALAAQEKPAANGATSKTTRGRANEEEEEEKEETKEEEEKEEEEEEETSTSAPAKGKQVQAKLSNYFGNAANKKKKTRR